MAEFFKNKNFIGAFGRATIKRTIQISEYAIINLDNSIGPDTHGVCYYDNYSFDPFGMPPPIKVIKHTKDIQCNGIQYQATKSVLYWYYCLYFLKRLNDGCKIYDILYIDFDYKNPMKNESMLNNF